jgi:hypothetical protein
VRVRPVRQFDVLAIRNLVSNPQSVLIAPSAFDDAPGLLSAVLTMGRERLWVASDKRGLAGFAQGRPRTYVLGWELIRVHIRPDLEAEAVVAPLVHAVLEHLQEQGIPRLFARTPLDSPAHEALARCGFTHFMSECILLRDPGPTRPPEEMPSGARYRMPEDAWPLHQLESRLTPPLVRQLEGLTSQSISRLWTQNTPTAVSHQRNALELVVERDGEIVGWIGWTARPRRGYIHLGLLIQDQDDAGEMASALVAYALHTISTSHPQARIVVRLREYQLELRRVLLDYNFVEYGREALHIKHGRLQFMPKKVPAVRFHMPRWQTPPIGAQLSAPLQGMHHRQFKTHNVG